MVKDKSASTTSVEQNSETEAPTPPRILSVTRKGVKNSKDLARFMSLLMCDLVEGKVAPNVGNAACNASGKLLRTVELEYKHGTANGEVSKKTLMLSIEEDIVEETN